MLTNKYVLVACECSQKVCKAFRDIGYTAFSCDLVDQYGGHPEWHIKADALETISYPVFTTTDGVKHSVPRWDIVIAFPPCTYLARVQFPLYDRKKYGNAYVDDRISNRDKAINFFRSIMSSYPTYCDHLAIENPIGTINYWVKSPSQIIRPCEFGDDASKATCLWLYNLPLLTPTNIIEPTMVIDPENGRPNCKWFADTRSITDPVLRSRVRSETFPGVAKAMADQWGKVL